uniref:Uncharacterized protein n=1 Tax=Arundo donax TaxID=35708 RepID=A0A0A9FSI3_ARUDO
MNWMPSLPSDLSLRNYSRTTGNLFPISSCLLLGLAGCVSSLSFLHRNKQLFPTISYASLCLENDLKQQRNRQEAPLSVECCH